MLEPSQAVPREGVSWTRGVWPDITACRNPGPEWAVGYPCRPGFHTWDAPLLPLPTSSLSSASSGASFPAGVVFTLPTPRPPHPLPCLHHHVPNKTDWLLNDHPCPAPGLLCPQRAWALGGCTRGSPTCAKTLPRISVGAGTPWVCAPGILPKAGLLCLHSGPSISACGHLQAAPAWLRAIPEAGSGGPPGQLVQLVSALGACLPALVTMSRLHSRYSITG